MQDLNDLYYFVQVVDHQGFAPAGRALNIPKSKLSRRLAALEERLGARLVQRSTRHFSVTEIGKEYYAHCRAMLVEARAAEETIERSRSEPCGVVRITCPVGLLHVHVGAMLSQFMCAYPAVQVHLEATNRRVDVIGEGIDVAIRVRSAPLEDSELMFRRFGERSRGLFASPAFMQQHGPFDVPADLSGKPSLDLGPPREEHLWRLQGADQAKAEIRHRPRLVTDDMIALRGAAAAGVGLVQLPTIMVLDLIRAGALLRLLPDWAPPRHVIHAVYPSRRGLVPAIRVLLDFLEQRFRQLQVD